MLSSMYVRRLLQLYAGLVLYGLSLALMLRSELGLAPWDVLHQGLARRTGLSIGTVVILVGVLVLLAWIPLRQRPGVGTVSNVFAIGLALDAGLAIVPQTHGWGTRVGLLVAGIVLNGVGGGAYIGARLGPGPRDGLMTGLNVRTGRSLRSVRTGIEITVLATGVVLGGTAGIGTLLYAVLIGPQVQLWLGVLTVPERPGAEPHLAAADH